MEMSEAILTRKSIRAYTDQPVADSALEKIIEAGRWAPNAGPFQISVVRNASLRQRINDATHDAMVNSDVEFLKQRAALPGYQPIYGAPVLILLSGPADVPTASSLMPSRFRSQVIGVSPPRPGIDRGQPTAKVDVIRTSTESTTGPVEK